MATDLSSRIEPLLQRVECCSVAIVGDFCLDAYWSFKEHAGEISVETGLPVRHLVSQRYSLGGAGNVLANLVAMRVGRVLAIGVRGHDPFGVKLCDLVAQHGCATEGIVVDPGWETMVYAKPCLGETEQSRIDFGAFNVPRQDSIDEILKQMEVAAEEDDKWPQTTFLVDARHHPEKYEGAMLKLNMSEAARLLKVKAVNAQEETDAIASEFALSISALKSAFITRGDRGMAVAQEGAVTLIPVFPVQPIPAPWARETLLSQALLQDWPRVLR